MVFCSSSSPSVHDLHCYMGIANAMPGMNMPDNDDDSHLTALISAVR